MGIEIRVPTLGESVTEATVGKWYKKPGDPVQIDDLSINNQFEERGVPPR